MSKFYSHNGAYPTVLPNRIVLSNGKSRTDRSTFTPEELADAGWVSVLDPPPVTYPNKLGWDGSDWIVRAPNAVEIEARWNEVRRTRDLRLAQTDYQILKAYEQGVAADPDLVTYRQAMRDIPQNTTDPFFVTWPSMPED